MKGIVTCELENVGRIASLIERGTETGSLWCCNVPLATTTLFLAPRAERGSYLRVNPKSWPETNEEIARNVYRFLKA